MYFYTWIAEPKEAPALYDQRKQHQQEFDNFILEDCEQIQYIAKKCGVDLDISELKKNHPFKFGAFCSQDITPITDKNGGPAEDGPVTWDGKSAK